MDGELTAGDIGHQLDGEVGVVAELEVQAGVVHGGVQAVGHIAYGKGVVGSVDDIQVGVHCAVVDGRGHLAHAAAVHGDGLAIGVAGGGLVAVGLRGVSDGAQVGEGLPGHEDFTVAGGGGQSHVIGAAGHAVQVTGVAGQQVLIQQGGGLAQIRLGDGDGDRTGLPRLGLFDDVLGLFRVDGAAHDHGGQVAVGVLGGGLGLLVDQFAENLAGELGTGNGLGLHGQRGLSGGQGVGDLLQQGVLVHLGPVGAHGDFERVILQLVGEVHRVLVHGLGNLVDVLLYLLLSLGCEGGGGQGQGVRVAARTQPGQAQGEETPGLLFLHAVLHGGLGVHIQQRAGNGHLLVLPVVQGQLQGVQVLLHGTGHILHRGILGQSAQVQGDGLCVILGNGAGEQTAVAADPGAQPAIGSRQHQHRSAGHDSGDDGGRELFLGTNVLHRTSSKCCYL